MHRTSVRSPAVHSRGLHSVILRCNAFVQPDRCDAARQVDAVQIQHNTDFQHSTFCMQPGPGVWLQAELRTPFGSTNSSLLRTCVVTIQYGITRNGVPCNLPVPVHSFDPPPPINELHELHELPSLFNIVVHKVAVHIAKAVAGMHPMHYVTTQSLVLVDSERLPGGVFKPRLNEELGLKLHHATDDEYLLDVSRSNTIIAECVGPHAAPLMASAELRVCSMAPPARTR